MGHFPFSGVIVGSPPLLRFFASLREQTKKGSSSKELLPLMLALAGGPGRS